MNGDPKIKDLFDCFSKDTKPTQFPSKMDGLIRGMRPEHVLLLNSRLPKQFISFDEQYLRRCLEFLQISTQTPASCSFQSDMSVFTFTSGNISEKTAIQCPVPEAETANLSSAGYSSPGEITKTKSMLNISTSPLLCQSGSSVSDRARLIDLREPKSTSSLSSHIVSNSTKSQNLDHARAFHPAHKGFDSLTCTNVTSSNLSTGAATISNWMLRCTWKNGLPRYVYSSDNHKYIYIANLLKVDAPSSKVLDYMYTFHSKASRRKEDGILEEYLNLVSKMKVSTSFTLLSDDTEIMETQFVLFGFGDNPVGEVQSTSHMLTKSNGLSTKVSKVLRASRTFRRKKSIRLEVSRSMKDITLSIPCQDARSEDHLSPNLELAAIVVKNQIPEIKKEADVGGWGLKFLNKIEYMQKNASVATKVPSQSHICTDAYCSTSIDIIIPAGLHGVPRARNRGPSSLIDRWRSGGACDCGGWDIGCALTILKTKETEVLPQADISRDGKTFDMFVQGSKQDSPPAMKMVKIRDSLYCIPFQSTLSALQSFSIAVAMLHSKNVQAQRVKNQ